jgi:hypothetical protein
MQQMYRISDKSRPGFIAVAYIGHFLERFASNPFGSQPNAEDDLDLF